MSLTPMFTMGQVFKYADDWYDRRIKVTMEGLAYAGEKFVNAARDCGNYQDKTGNLRSSIGYVILLDGEVKLKNVEEAGVGSDQQTGRQTAESFIEWAKNEWPKGFVLIGFAGMEYAASVESKGYDVISGSVPLTEELLKDFRSSINEFQYMDL